MKLLIGQRLRLESNEMFARIIAGKVEAYAVTRDASSFRQIFFARRSIGRRRLSFARRL